MSNYGEVCDEQFVYVNKQFNWCIIHEKAHYKFSNEGHVNYGCVGRLWVVMWRRMMSSYVYVSKQNNLCIIHVDAHCKVSNEGYRSYG